MFIKANVFATEIGASSGEDGFDSFHRNLRLRVMPGDRGPADLEVIDARTDSGVLHHPVIDREIVPGIVDRDDGSFTIKHSDVVREGIKHCRAYFIIEGEIVDESKWAGSASWTG
jgi:hypothetical protein